jgi:hypothetical protein
VEAVVGVDLLAAAVVMDFYTVLKDGSPVVAVAAADTLTLDLISQMC